MFSLPTQDGEYRTQPRRVSWLSRWFPSTVFFSKLAWIIWRASRKAKAGKYDGAAWADSSLEVMRALESVGVEFEITGIEHLEEVVGPCLVVGNHMSTLETTVLPGVIQPIKEVTFVIKQSLLDYPIFKHVMRSRDPIAVSQLDARADFKAMLTGAAERLARGVSVIVFPEGERAAEFLPKNFNTIGVKIAQRNEVPIVPLALDSWTWPLGTLVSDVARLNTDRKVRFAFGPPLTVSGRGVAEQQAIVEFIQKKRSEWGLTNPTPAPLAELPS